MSEITTEATDSAPKSSREAPRSALPPRRKTRAPQVVAMTLISLALLPVALEIAFRLMPQAIPLEACSTSEFLSVQCQWWYAYDHPMRVGYTYRPGYRFEGPFNPADPAVIGAAHLTCAPPRDETFTLALHADKNGFLNDEPLNEQYDIVMTGDSFSQPFSPVFWLDELERLTGMSALNLGMDGWGTLSEVEAIRQYGLDKNPQWVIFLYFEGNDLFNVEEYLRRQESGLDWREYQLQAVQPMERLVLPHMLRYWAGSASLPEQPDQACIYPMTVASEINRFETVFFDVHIDQLAENRQQIEANSAWAAATGAILELRNKVEAQGGRFLLVYVPAKEHVTWDRVWEPEEINNFLARAIPLRSFQEYDQHIDDQMEMMYAFAHENDIEFLNLYWPYRKATLQGVEMYNYADVHWNALGNTLAAKLIERYILTHP